MIVIIIVTIVFPHIRPAGIIFVCGLQLWVLLNFTYIKVCLVRALLEMWVLFKEGSYMRKYGIYCELLKRLIY